MPPNTFPFPDYTGIMSVSVRSDRNYLQMAMAGVRGCVRKQIVSEGKNKQNIIIAANLASIRDVARTPMQANLKTLPRFSYLTLT